MNNLLQNTPIIGISRCLLGDAVRYDGKPKHHPELIEALEQAFELLPVCPEVEAGLSIPRPALQLSNSIEHPQVTGRDDPSLDLTELMQDYCNLKTTELSGISGYVFKSRSPSCGMGSVPVYANRELITNSSNGIFSQTLLHAYPDLPAAEETILKNPLMFEDFKIRVFRYNAAQT
jgi:uncharacterized protein YbbK (DUF523 family)